MELWNELIVEKSQRLLLQLKKKTDFVLIGGWAVYFYTKSAKSKDIDFYINFEDFFKLQSILSEVGVFISQNPKLKKYEAKFEEVDVDIYTPAYCNLIVPCKDVFKNKMFEIIEGFKVISPEPLLILKLKAEKERSHSLAGFKDRIDILSLLHRVDIDKKILLELGRKYKFNNIKERLSNIIKTSKEEYGYFFENADNLRELKKLKVSLLKKL